MKDEIAVWGATYRHSTSLVPGHMGGQTFCFPSLRVHSKGTHTAILAQKIDFLFSVPFPTTTQTFSSPLPILTFFPPSLPSFLLAFLPPFPSLPPFLLPFSYFLPLVLNFTWNSLKCIHQTWPRKARQGMACGPTLEEGRSELCLRLKENESKTRELLKPAIWRNGRKPKSK